ncbi:MAG: hypothetical protein FWC39_12960 [Bacteroidetes bacterium]|nr:hypothetical protein [Bacteroidota bacterium]
MKKTFIFLALLAIIAITSSCSKEESDMYIYTVGVSEFSGSFSDLAAVENYFNQFSIPARLFLTGKGKSTAAAAADADAQARKQAEQWVAKFNAEDIKNLELSSDVSFRWTVQRNVNPTDPNSDEFVVVSDFKWPQ